MADIQQEDTPEPDRITRARERRARRRYVHHQEEQRIYFLDELASQASTSIEFLISTIIAGTLIGAGFRFDQPVLLIAAVLSAPRMAPILGLAMGSILGRIQAVLRVAFNLIIMLVIVMVTAGIIGGIGTDTSALDGTILQYTELNFLNFGFVVIATILLAILVVQDGTFSPLPSAAIAYEILLPLGACAVGIMTAREEIWRGAFINFALHLSWSVTSGMVVFLVMGFRPISKAARNFILAIFTMSLVIVLSLLSLGGSILAAVPIPTQTTVALPTTATASLEPVLTPTPSLTSTQTLTAVPPTQTPRPPTATPTPAIGVVYGTGGLGVVIRDAPSGNRIGGLLDGDKVEIVGGPLEVNGLLWYQVITEEGEEAWMTGTYMATATPGS